jgi:hypothetical protein
MSYGVRELASDRIGELVMRELRKIDKVAYIRFASVYRSFEDVEAFADVIEELRPPLGHETDVIEELRPPLDNEQEVIASLTDRDQRFKEVN